MRIISAAAFPVQVRLGRGNALWCVSRGGALQKKTKENKKTSDLPCTQSKWCLKFAPRFIIQLFCLFSDFVLCSYLCVRFQLLLEVGHLGKLKKRKPVFLSLSTRKLCPLFPITCFCIAQGWPKRLLLRFSFKTNHLIWSENIISPQRTFWMIWRCKNRQFITKIVLLSFI